MSPGGEKQASAQPMQVRVSGLEQRELDGMRDWLSEQLEGASPDTDCAPGVELLHLLHASQLD